MEQSSDFHITKNFTESTKNYVLEWKDRLPFIRNPKKFLEASHDKNRFTGLTAHDEMGIKAIHTHEAQSKKYESLDKGEPDWFEYALKPDASIDIGYTEQYTWGGTPVGGVQAIVVVAGAGEKNSKGPRVLYLPYIENKLTYMKLDDTADFVITGPLNGCSVYVATAGSDTYLFHVNDNIGKGKSETIEVHGETYALNSKDEKFKIALSRILPDSTIRHRLTWKEYGAESPLAAEGFVVGVSPPDSSNWKFLFNSIAYAIEAKPIRAVIKSDHCKVALPLPPPDSPM